MRRFWLTLLVFVLYLLHQDFWNWTEVKPLVFGFLPIGLWYHAAYTLASALLMWILIRLAWPDHLEDFSNNPALRDQRR